MYHEITSALQGHALLGAVLAILAIATAFWLHLAFRSARVAIRELSELNQSLRTSPRPRPVVEARVS
jgi:hypothetical protein